MVPEHAWNWDSGGSLVRLKVRVFWDRKYGCRPLRVPKMFARTMPQNAGSDPDKALIACITCFSPWLIHRMTHYDCCVKSLLINIRHASHLQANVDGGQCTCVYAIHTIQLNDWHCATHLRNCTTHLRHCATHLGHRAPHTRHCATHPWHAQHTYNIAQCSLDIAQHTLALVQHP